MNLAKQRNNSLSDAARNATGKVALAPLDCAQADLMTKTERPKLAELAGQRRLTATNLNE